MSVSVGSIHYDLSLDKSAFDRASASVNSSLGTMGGVATGVIKSVAAVGAVLGVAFVAAGGFAIKSASDVQMLRTNLDVLTGSAEKGAKMFSDLYKMAKTTPFETTELVDSAKVLLAYGLSQEAILPTLRQLGDVSLGNKEKLGQLTIAFGQVKSKGRLMGQELLQMTNVGFNPLQMKAAEMAKEFGGLSQDYMPALTKQMEQGGISVEFVADQLEKATSTGGLFYQGMEKGAQTMQGTWSTLMDNVGMFARKMVGLSETGDVVKGSLFDKMAQGMKDLNKWFDDNATTVDLWATAISNSFINVSNWISGAVSTVVTQLAKVNWSDIWKSIVDMGTAIGDYLAPKIKNLYDKIVEIMPQLQTIYEKIIVPLAIFIGQVLVVAVGALVDGLSWLIPVLANLYSFMATNILPVLKKMWDWFAKYILPTLQEFVGFVWGALVFAFESIKKAVDDISNALEPFISKQDQLNLLLIAVGVILGLILLPFIIATAVIVAITLTIAGLIGIIATLIGWVANVISWFVNLAVNVWNSMVKFSESVGKGIGDVIQWFKDLPGKIGSALSDIGTWLYEAGKKLIQGFIDGIKNMAGAVGTAVSDTVGNLGSFAGDIGKNIGGFLQLAEGTNYAPGGMALVGEEGPELVNLPRGSQVTPNDKLNLGSSVSTSIYGDINIGSKSDADYFFNRLDRSSDLLGMGLAG